MLNLGVVPQGSTVEFPFSTAAALGGAESFNATVEVADCDIYPKGSATQRASTAGWTISEDIDAVDGLHGGLLVDLSDDTDSGFYVPGQTYKVSLTPDETVDGQTLAGWLGVFTIETNAQMGARLAAQVLAPITIGSSGNSTSALNLSAASIPDGYLDGELLLVYDDSADVWVGARCSAITSDIAAVTALDGGVLPFTPEASTDLVVRTGTQAALTAAEANAQVAAALGTYDPPTRAELTSDIAGLDAKADIAQADLDVITGSAGVVLDNDAITEDKYDESTAFPVPAVIPFSSAGNVQSDTQEINETGIVGDGDGTPFDVA